MDPLDGGLYTLDVDGMESEGVVFIGEAVRTLDGSWLALGNAGGMLCRVEIRVTLFADEEGARRDRK